MNKFLNNIKTKLNSVAGLSKDIKESIMDYLKEKPSYEETILSEIHNLEKIPKEKRSAIVSKSVANSIDISKPSDYTSIGCNAGASSSSGKSIFYYNEEGPPFKPYFLKDESYNSSESYYKKYAPRTIKRSDPAYTVSMRSTLGTYGSVKTSSSIKWAELEPDMTHSENLSRKLKVECDLTKSINAKKTLTFEVNFKNFKSVKRIYV